MRHGVQTIGAARIPGQEHQFPVVRTFAAPLQIVIHFDRNAVFVSAEERDVQVVARILEVVRIAAEKGDIELRREHQPHVGVLLVAIEMILAAVVKRDHIAAQPGTVERFLFNRIDGRAPRSLSRARGHLGLDRRVDARGDILHRVQHVQFEIRASRFVSARGRLEAQVDVVLLPRAQFLNAIGAHVLVGQHQAVV